MGYPGAEEWAAIHRPTAFHGALYALISFAPFSSGCIASFYCRRTFVAHPFPPAEQLDTLLLLRDAVLRTSFFYLLFTYLSYDPEEQKKILRKEGSSKQNDAERLRRGEQPKEWFSPLGFVKWKLADGLYFLQHMKWAVLQYYVVRPMYDNRAAIMLSDIGMYGKEA
ncbi:hypothetical protein OF83DRAFT_1178518 [Amylostereum chailletii]|nr:hypothetical protein OF83DRAFT_1178518 [Amylostereum chailletii]